MLFNYMNYLNETNQSPKMRKTMAIEVNAENFENEVLNSDIPVLVDFWAPWCGPCTTLSPVLDGLQAKLKDKAKICKINIDENPDLANKYSVRGIPTVITFKHGQDTDFIVGVNNEARYLKTLQNS